MNRRHGQKLLLIGAEASKTMSPRLWSPVLSALGSDWTYEALDVAADADMDPVREQLLSPAVIAANVTMPHKQWAARTATTATPAVQRSGAANFLIRSKNDLQAHNTDMDAFIALAPQGSIRHALLLGAGGAARASIAALGTRVDRVTIADQALSASESLRKHATALGIQAETVPWDELSKVVPPATLIVNATPIGKHTDDLPPWGSAQPTAGTFIYDYVYAKHITSTIQSARTLNLPCADGWNHLWAQAAAMAPLLGLPDRTSQLLHKSLNRLRRG